MILSVWNFGVDFSLMKNTKQNKRENKAENKDEHNAKIQPMTNQFLGIVCPIFWGIPEIGSPISGCWVIVGA